jgi:hypothetical protein
MASHLGLEKIPCLGLSKKQKLLFNVQHMLKNPKSTDPFFRIYKTDFLSKFESLNCNSFGFIQNIKLLHVHIHEQYFILSWLC